MNKKPDLLIINCKELLTMRGASKKPKAGQQLDDVGVIHDGAIAICEERITDIGETKTLKVRYKDCSSIIDASGKVVSPGFVDCHTHAVFGGSRERELVEKIKGETYLDILKQGGGILSTVCDTRKLSIDKLIKKTKKHLDNMLAHGTTTVEIKSGYGLDLENELKILKVIKVLNETHPIDIVPTFLGAHVVPEEYKTNPDQYVNLVIYMLSEVKEYAKYCDVFCDSVAFTVEQSKRILTEAKERGLSLKMHINEFKNIGGARLGADLGVVSADHLDLITDGEIDELVKTNVIGVLLPGVNFYLMNNNYAPLKSMLEKGLPIALATDFNPGTCPTENMQIIITIACLEMKMSTEQALNASTINAAHAIGVANEVGSLEAGKIADIILFDIPDYNYIPYHFGVNNVEKVIKRGRLVVDNNRG
ncbi:MAG: imidazolonepropionase [Candidatus Scalindua sediminis]|nr:imidazolonepropionase [Candidatus Scalindua sediminis]